eukprot:TRINITY_DN43271_c0_g1_i1.p1 TRINITY_DN43271_c0_g1~~TRINITY_DN43271_c0_g1_i1.p1  ORF type:complete len:292 (+),score=17.03 TRINITY_DN43271_c0_g1_i1:108-983(+)
MATADRCGAASGGQPAGCLMALTQEVRDYALCFLPAADVCRTMRVSRGFHQACTAETLWEGLCCAALGRHVEPTPRPGAGPLRDWTWREAYAELWRVQWARPAPPLAIDRPGGLTVTSRSPSFGWRTVTTPRGRGLTEGVHYWEISFCMRDEAMLCAGGRAVVGVAALSDDFDPNMRLGVTQDTWGFLSHSGEKSANTRLLPYAVPYGNGDVVGVLLDCDAGELSFWLNGDPLGVAFGGLRGRGPLHPALSLCFVTATLDPLPVFPPVRRVRPARPSVPQPNANGVYAFVD